MPLMQICAPRRLRRKFYAKNDRNVTYVKFLRFARIWSKFCGLAHSQRERRGVDWNHVHEVLHAVHIDRRGLSRW